MSTQPITSMALRLTATILALLCWGSTCRTLADGEPRRFSITGSSELWWLESGYDHFGPHSIRGFLSVSGSNHHSSVVAVGRSRPVEDVAVYSTDGTDSMVLGGRPELLEGALAFMPNHIEGFGFITPGVVPAHTDPALPIDDIQVIALALQLLSTQASDSDLRTGLGELTAVRENPLLPETGLPESAYRIRKSETDKNAVDTWIQVEFPGQGMHRNDKYEYVYPGPFRATGYIGYSLRITSPAGAIGPVRIESTNHVPDKSIDLPGAAYDTSKPSQVRHIQLILAEADESPEPTGLAMKQLKRVDVNDHRPGGDLKQKTGIQLSSANEWPGRGTREFAQTMEHHERKVGSGRKFQWIFGGAVLLAGAICLHLHFRAARHS